MTEKEKAAAGFLFDANNDPENLNEIKRSLDLCHTYNSLMPSDVSGHKKILEHIFEKSDESTIVTPPFWCDHCGMVSVGKSFYSNHNLVITAGASVVFGDFVFIAPNCCFTTAEHAIDAEQRRQGLEIAKPITVGSNVWIGAGSTVLAGVSIGNNSVIGAGSVVKHDIPPNVVAVGVPCRVIRKITAADKERYPVYR